jgi:hypothetical protein
MRDTELPHCREPTVRSSLLWLLRFEATRVQVATALTGNVRVLFRPIRAWRFLRLTQGFRSLKSMVARVGVGEQGLLHCRDVMVKKSLLWVLSLI